MQFTAQYRLAEARGRIPDRIIEVKIISERLAQWQIWIIVGDLDIIQGWLDLRNKNTLAIR